MKAKLPVLVFVVALVFLTIASSCAQNSSGPSSSNTPANSGNADGANANGRQSQQGRNGGQNPTNGAPADRPVGSVGTVDDVTTSGFTLVMENGRVPVVVGSTTRISRMAEGNPADLKVGDQIVAMGNQQGDGSFTANSIQVVPANSQQGNFTGFGNGNDQAGQGGGPRGQGQGNGQPQGTPRAGAPGSQRPVEFGTIEAIAGDLLTVKVQAGTASKVTVTNETTIRKTADITLAAIKAGENAVVNGERNDKGAIVAVSVQVGTAAMLANGR